MKRKVIYFQVIAGMVGLLLASSVNAQVIDKVVKGNSTVKGATNAITDTKNTVKLAKDVVGGLFKRKKKKTEGKDSTATAKVLKVTIITIANIDYGTLKELEDSLQVIEGVETTKKTFNSGTSMIEVGFAGESDELWDIIPARIKELLELKILAERRIAAEFRKPS